MSDVLAALLITTALLLFCGGLGYAVWAAGQPNDDEAAPPTKAPSGRATPRSGVVIPPESRDWREPERRLSVEEMERECEIGDYAPPVCPCGKPGAHARHAYGATFWHCDEHRDRPIEQTWTADELACSLVITEQGDWRRVSIEWCECGKHAGTRYADFI